MIKIKRNFNIVSEFSHYTEYNLTNLKTPNFLITENGKTSAEKPSTESFPELLCKYLIIEETPNSMYHILPPEDDDLSIELVINTHQKNIKNIYKMKIFIDRYYMDYVFLVLNNSDMLNFNNIEFSHLPAADGRIFYFHRPLELDQYGNYQLKFHLINDEDIIDRVKLNKLLIISKLNESDFYNPGAYESLPF